MSKFLFNFIQISSGFLRVKNTQYIAMSKKIGFHEPPKYRPDLKAVKSQTSTKSSTSLTLSVDENVDVLNEPIKSDSDKKLYKTIKLQNGLTALLISDPSNLPEPEEEGDGDGEEEIEAEEDADVDSEPSDQESDSSTGSKTNDSKKKKKLFDDEKLAACALCVGVGSYSDPPDIQGLAHFVEHMVFMGSEKYPKENEFDAFVKKNGGSDNASTDCEVTTFYFEIQEKHLAHAMDMFSQFFVSPLMKKEAMQREREAIESEFAIASPSDMNRKDQLLSTMFPEGHPARTFTWGNLKSLRDDIKDDDKLYQAAHEFRRRHYSANRMTLAIQARMDLDTLEQYVKNTFSHVPNNNLPPLDFSKYQFSPATITTAFKSMYYIKPISDTSELHLTWCLRSLLGDYESKPHQYVSHLLGHEGKGSLLSYLRKKVWALGIYTGNSESGIDYTSMYSLFSMQVVLTKDGLEHVDSVIEAIFSYITKLVELTPSERVFNEIKMIEETSFDFEEETQPVQYVESLAENMHFYKPEHYITGDKLYYKYDPKAIEGILDIMRADKVNIIILSNKHAKPIVYNAKEKWFGTDYRRTVIPAAWVKRWKEVTSGKEFNLPEENIYITTDFDLIEVDKPYMEEAQKIDIDLEVHSVKDIRAKMEMRRTGSKILMHENVFATVTKFRLDTPNVIRRNRKMEVWYRPDYKFRFPTALLYFYFITPLSLKSPKDACLLDLWTDVLQQNLKEEVYPANMADLSHSIYVADKGISIKISGYSQNLHLLVELITNEMKRPPGTLTQELFDAVKDVRSRIYHNLLLKPNKLAKDVRMDLLLKPYISPRSKAREIEAITLEDYNKFSKVLLKRMFLQMLVQGNLHWYDVIRMAEKLYSTIKWKGIRETKLPDFKVRDMLVGEAKMRIMSLNDKSTNSIITNYYQGEAATPRDTATLEILMMLMEEPVFDSLRTKQQLGYSVFSMMRYTFGVLGFSVTVNTQVDKYSVSYVNQRIEEFLKKFGRDIVKKLKEKTLAATKDSLIQLKYTTDYELREEVERNWREITTREFNFHRLLDEAEAIQNVHLDDVKDWVDNHFPGGNLNEFKKLSIQIVGHPKREEGNEANVEPIVGANAEKGEEEEKKYELTFLDGTEPGADPAEVDDEFITDINDYKEDLGYIFVPRLLLTQIQKEL